LEVELDNIILVLFRFFEFLHSQGQSETQAHRPGMTVLSPGMDMSMTGRFAPEAAGQNGRFCSRR
jgi:hypothetical protein